MTVIPIPVVTELKPEDTYDAIFVVVRYTQIETVVGTLQANGTKKGNVQTPCGAYL